MHTIYEIQGEIRTLLGQDSWDDVVEWFGAMTEAEIKAELDRCWPDEESNENLAALIFDNVG